jgi:hypothetical protein
MFDSAGACPRCESIRTRPLPELSRDADVDYFRCDHCAHVWTTPKNHRADPALRRRQEVG